MDSHPIGFSNDTKIFSSFCYETPMPNASIGLYFGDERISKNSLHPLHLDVSPPDHDAILKI